MSKSKGSGLGIAGVVLVVLVLAGLLSLLMPGLRSVKRAAYKRAMEVDRGYWTGAQQEGMPDASEAPPDKRRPRPVRAIVESFDANIHLTPRLSVGTATPESIYEARFEADLKARKPTDGPEECEILLPLPPQIISLADLTVEINGDPSDDVSHESGYLVWRGRLDAEQPTKFHVVYTAVGKGIFKLEKPPGRIINSFKTILTAHHSNVRMLELSLQPAPPQRDGDRTVYTWDYDRLLVGRPIALDVLGIAAVDQLGEIVWLGPISVLAFGFLVTMLTVACRPGDISVWSVLLIVGCFAAAYPLMYFLQEFLPLLWAVGAAAALGIVIIGVRSVTLFGPRAGGFGGVLLPVMVMGLAVAATIYAKPAVQGVLLTILGILTLVVAMVLLPRAQRAYVAAHPQPPAPPLPAAQTQGPVGEGA
ncbi:MAG TPA: hypothetical protein VNA25_23710 [Phycisphaerae bacterium]|nr:hypothetical protein [Phycisphaerae bacterium]